MINIYKPDPRKIPVLGDSRRSVPLGVFPEFIGLFQVALRQSRVHISVHLFVSIRGILRILLSGSRVVNIVELHRCVSAPSPHKRCGLCPVIGRIPADALCRHLDSNLFQLVCGVLRKCLADGIPCRIEHVELGADTVFLQYSITSGKPSGFL